MLSALMKRGGDSVSCLVRPSTEAGGHSRIRQTLMSYGLWEPSFEERVRAIEGDLCRPRLGLPLDRYEALSREIGAIYHCAAEVNWVYPYAGLRATNVQAVVELLRLACRIRPKAFHFISTMAVCYSTAGPRELGEGDEMLPHLGGIHLGYAQSKCVAESLVLRAGERGLPVAIYRPSLISGDSRSGLSNTGDFLSALLKGCIQMGAAPDLDWVLDACPADYAAECIVGLARVSGHTAQVFHLANPKTRHWRECVLWMNLFGYPVRLVPYQSWLEQLERGSGKPGHALRYLRSFFLNRPAGEGGLTLPELYEETRRSRVSCDATQRTLQDLGIACPRLDAQLLDRYFSSFIDQGFLPEPVQPRATKRASLLERLDPALFTSILRKFYNDETLRVTDVTAKGSGSDKSIITELTSWKYGGRSGLFPYRLNVCRKGSGTIPLDVMVKVKPKDEEVIEVGAHVARLCGEDAGRAYEKSKDRTGLASCHLRELAIYEQEDQRFRSHMPTVYGSLRDDTQQCWVLVLEHLSDTVLMDTADDVSGWRRPEIEVAIRGLAELHADWYRRERTLLEEPWLGTVYSADEMVEMTDLWTALADYAGDRFSEWSGMDLHPLQKELIAGLGDWWSELEALPRTLIHNDFNPRNITLRKREGSLSLCAYDWELATLGAPQHDLAEFLCFVLTHDVTREVVLDSLELHRVALEQAAGQPIDAGAWQLGFRLSLADLILNRFAMYRMVHTFRRQTFLPRVTRTWRRLSELFPL